MTQPAIASVTRPRMPAVVMVIGLAIIGLAMRLPYWPAYTFHWDTAQFALSVLEFDLHTGQPHPPGFFLFVALAKLINGCVNDPHASIIWISMVAGATLPPLGWLLARSMFGQRTAAITAVILLTSPLTWFHSVVGLTTMLDAVLVVGFMLAGWAVIRSGGRRRDVIIMAGLLSVIAGVRLPTVIVLMPATIYILCRVPTPRARPVIMAALVLFGMTMAWFIPLVRATGGAVEYLALVKAKADFDAPKAIWGGGGWDAFSQNLQMIVASCWGGLLLALPLAAVGLGWRRVYSDALAIDRRARELLIIWLLSGITFWLVTYVTMPGYVLNFFPAVAIGCGWLIAEKLRPTRNHFAALVVMIASINVVAFIAPTYVTERWLMKLPITGSAIRQHDRELAACFDLIEKQFSPENTVIYHGVESFYFGFRHFQYHLPEYANVLLDPSQMKTSQSVWLGMGRQTIVAPAHSIPPADTVVCVVPPGLDATIFSRWFDAGSWEAVTGSDGRLFRGKRTQR